MRKDMAKIIVERPRGGGGYKTPKGSLRALQRMPMDEWPTKEGMQRHWSRNPKWLNENLAPLRRFLRSNLGRHWDDVNSEIRERINLNSVVQLHIWQHVIQYVCINVFEREGIYLDQSGRRIWQRFYVDPETRMLRENPNYRRRKVAAPKEYLTVDALTQYRKLNGIWFEVQLKPLPNDRALVWDVVLKCYCIHKTYATFAQYYGDHAYAVGKRQLNSKEIQALKAQYGAEIRGMGHG